MTAIVPVYAYMALLGSMSVNRESIGACRVFSRLSNAGSCFSFMRKSTPMGLSDEMVASTVCPTVIRSPSLTWLNPTVPSKGAEMTEYVRLVFAFFSASWADLEAFREFSSVIIAWS